MLGGIGGQEEKGRTEDEMAGCITDSIDVSLSELREVVMDREAWRAAIHGVAKSQTRLSNWTELGWLSRKLLKEELLCSSFFPSCCLECRCED